MGVESFKITQTFFKEYEEWQIEDKKTIKKINILIKEITRNPKQVGIGKSEKLKHLKDLYSVRIDKKNRLVYKLSENGEIAFITCKGHYED